MSLEPLTPANTTIVLVDHAVGFANVLRSHDTAAHINNVVGLAKTAVLYQSGLVVTNGLPSKPSGPLYPQLLEVIGDHPVIERGGNFNGFLDEGFAEAVRRTGRRKLAIAGVSTEGCVLQTVLGALREGYEVYLVVDASASVTAETHAVAVQRMVQAGAVPVTWFSLAGEFQVDHRYPTAPHYQRLMREHVATMGMGVQSYLAALDQAKAAV
ncbi:nicotinamidase-related amidase [Thermocatellispora tengchongensis]|uniref:Nicotinamidase-related amidase n=1 Tax=Thermocatellispora tengchongensis TaxID=1073253 RepID=A0A840PEM2_9ACTN|nr:isochorismatase family protein [Thermocatellispora tengchongensis]MBB5134485.1 nicotinamidase-related amidase [Thermocatellispora tengchongensis]